MTSTSEAAIAGSPEAGIMLGLSPGASSSAEDRMPAPARPRSEALLAALRLVAPGSQLRDGIERIIQAHMGALIVVGAGPDVLSVCSGGFLLDAEFTPQRLSELAKMDGAIILTGDCQRIVRS